MLYNVVYRFHDQYGNLDYMSASGARRSGAATGGNGVVVLGVCARGVEMKKNLIVQVAHSWYSERGCSVTPASFRQAATVAREVASAACVTPRFQSGFFY